MDSWQPIVTAPKDGRCVLLTYKNALGKTRVVIGAFESVLMADEFEDETGNQAMSEPAWYETSWVSEEAHHVEEDPTHWMPIPWPEGSTASGGADGGIE
jgi:Protein of unknown function (DUF551)